MRFEEEVLRLEVAVDDVMLVVAVLNGQQRLADERGGVVLGEGPYVGLGFGDDAVEELAALVGRGRGRGGGVCWFSWLV